MEEFKVMDSLVKNFNNASDNAIEEIKASYKLQDIARDSRYPIHEVKELHRMVDNVEQVEKIIYHSEILNVDPKTIVTILKEFEV